MFALFSARPVMQHTLFFFHDVSTEVEQRTLCLILILKGVTLTDERLHHLILRMRVTLFRSSHSRSIANSEKAASKEADLLLLVLLFLKSMLHLFLGTIQRFIEVLPAS